MKKLMLTLSIIVIVTFFYSLRGQVAWTQKADLSGKGRAGAVSFAIGNKGYVGTGCANDGNGSGAYFIKDFWEYNPLNNTWAQKANFGGAARYGGVGFSIGSKGYLTLGSDFDYGYSDLWEYNQSSNTWTRKAYFGGTIRTFAIGFSIGSKGYIGFGAQCDTFFKDFWEFDPISNTWTKKNDFPGEGRARCIGFSIGNKGYIGLGRAEVGSFPSIMKYYKDFWEYDPSNDTWTKKADFKGAAREFAYGFSIDSLGYIAMGQDSLGNHNKEFWEYNPKTDSWTQKPSISGSAREFPIAFSINSKGYLGLGLTDTSSLKDFWEYNPSYNSIVELDERIMKIYPNPFSQSTQITLNQTYQNITLAVYDIQGKQVAQQHYTNCSQIQLHRNNLTNGLYFVKLTLDDKAVETVKVVVGD